MLVNISHAVWMHGLLPRQRYSTLIPRRSLTPVEIGEVASSELVPAFRVGTINGGPPSMLMTRADRPQEDGVWWPLCDVRGVPLSVSAWTEAISGPFDGQEKVDAGFGWLRNLHWTVITKNTEPRRVIEDYADEQRTQVAVHAARDLMICDGVVWRRKADPVFRVGGAPAVSVCVIRDRVEEMVGFSHWLSGGVLWKSPNGEWCDRDTPGATGTYNAYAPGTPEGRRNMWAADQRSSWDLYFRADDVDLATCQAREFRKLKNFPTIDVLAPEHVQTIASIANLKTACMQAYAAASVDRDGMSFFNEDLDAAYDEFAELVWQGSDDVAKLRTAAHDARRLTACNFKASRAHSAIEAALSQVDRDLELGRIPTPLDADDEAALRIAGL